MIRTSLWSLNRPESLMSHGTCVRCRNVTLTLLAGPQNEIGTSRSLGKPSRRLLGGLRSRMLCEHRNTNSPKAKYPDAKICADVDKPCVMCP